MSILKLSNGEITESENEIQQELACLNIQIKSYDSQKSLDFAEESAKLLVQDVLSYAEKDQILQSHKNYFEPHKAQVDNLCYDLLVLHPGSPKLHSLTATYSRYHTHTDAEALYVLSGEAIFGFVKPDGSQVELLLRSHDYIHIPPGCEHWFSTTASLHLKAVRYFATADGWMPQHTGRALNLEIY
ncbi:MAG: cupin domain-containing protein [Heteroscytonema crispum UTEX LB 1556]